MKRVVHIFSRVQGLKEIIASLYKDVEFREVHPPSGLLPVDLYILYILVSIHVDSIYVNVILRIDLNE